MNNNRANPLDIDASDLKPKATPSRSIDAEAVHQVAEPLGFVSRSAPASAPAAVRPLRRRQSDRHLQVNIRASAATIEKLVQISEVHRWPFGETLQLALTALEQKLRGD
jgi:hypothetical protein